MISKLVCAVAVAALLVACGGSNTKNAAAPASEHSGHSEQSEHSQHAEHSEGGHHGDHHGKKAGAAKQDVKAPGEAKPGDASRCTVTGEEIDVEASTPHSEHNGKTYYFCCTGCKKKFDAEPGKYTKS